MAGRNFGKTTILSFVFLAIIGAGCGLFENDFCFRAYHFKAPWQLSPARYTYQVGDTVDLEWNFPFRSVDTLSGDTFDVRNLLLPKDYKIQTVRIANGESFPIGPDAFLFTTESGSIISNENPFFTTFFLFPDETDNAFIIKGKMIMKESGIYEMRFSYDQSTFDDVEPFGNCQAEDVIYYFPLNGGDITANHYDQALQLLDTLEAPAVYRRLGMYTFEVME